VEIMGRVVTDPTKVRATIEAAPKRGPCRRVLMASPAHFTVESVINPWMKDDQGALNRVDPKKALEQWTALRKAYERIGVRVEVIEAPEGLPDFCFAANQSLVFDEGVVLAVMANESRKPEVAHFEAWYKNYGFRLRRLPKTITRFEGTGDAIAHPGRKLYWGGIGPRTEEAAWKEVAKLTGTNVIPLRLADERFYHLDTCLSMLNEDSALYIGAALDEDSRARVHAGIKHLHALSFADAANFACNAHCPDGRHVLLQQGSTETVQWLKDHGFVPVELDTSEFMKSGGSVFCLKQELV
jgi:N-dimethylarginine dimethylaminohydrolase